jgi:hypothetical protein
MFDDFIETRPGAARHLESHLNRPRQHVAVINTESESSLETFEESNSISSIQPPSTQTTNDDYCDITNANNQSRYIPSSVKNSGPTTLDGNLLTEQLWLLTCADEQKYTTKLVHLDMDPLKIRSDMELSRILKKQHLNTRQKWWQAIRPRGLITIKFVQVYSPHPVSPLPREE